MSTDAEKMRWAFHQTVGAILAIPLYIISLFKPLFIATTTSIGCLALIIITFFVPIVLILILWRVW
jgi:hypothetical protein